MSFIEKSNKPLGERVAIALFMIIGVTLGFIVWSFMLNLLPPVISAIGAIIIGLCVLGCFILAILLILGYELPDEKKTV